MAALKKLVKHTAVYGISSVLGRLLFYLLVPLHTRIFEQQEYGTVSQLYAFATFLMIVFTYGMETSFFNFFNKNENSHKVFSTSFNAVFISSIILVSLILFFIDPIASALQYENHKEYIFYFALILGFDAVTAIPFANLRMENKAFKFAIFKMSNILIGISLNLYFLIVCRLFFLNSSLDFLCFGYNGTNGIEYVFISNLVASSITFLLFLPQILPNLFKIDFSLLKKMLIYGLPLLIAGLAGMTNETIDRILLVHYLPFSHTENLALNGVYAACYKLSILMTLAIQAFRMAAEPFYFSKAKEADSKPIFASVMDHFVSVCFLIFLGVCLNLFWLKYFIGENYWDGLKVVPILLLANLFLGVYFNLSVWYKLTGKTSFGAYLAIFGAILTLVINIYGIPSFGYMASAWATFVCYFSMLVLCFYFGQKYYPIPYKLKSFSIKMIIALILYFASNIISTLFGPMNLLSSIIINNVLLLVFVGYLYVDYTTTKKLVN